MTIADDRTTKTFMARQEFMQVPGSLHLGLYCSCSLEDFIEHVRKHSISRRHSSLNTALDARETGLAFFQKAIPAILIKLRYVCILRMH
jgi:hypothetical protein